MLMPFESSIFEIFVDDKVVGPDRENYRRVQRRLFPLKRAAGHSQENGAAYLFMLLLVSSVSGPTRYIGSPEENELAAHA